MNLNIRIFDISCGIILIAAIAAGVFLIQNNFSNHNSEIKLNKLRLEGKKQKLKLAKAKLEHLKLKSKQQKNSVHELNKRIPNDLRIGDFLADLHTVVKYRDITLIDFNHKAPQAFEAYKHIPVHIVIQGDFLNIYRMIYDLETSNRLFIIEKISIDRKEEQNMCRATLMANVFQQ